MIKLIATDMDGTFLDDRGSYDRERLGRLLPELAKRDIIFTVASGRALLAVDKLFEPFRDQIAVIAENGCVASYRDQLLYEQAMAPELYLSLVDLLQDNPYSTGKEVLLSGRQGSYLLESAPQSYRDFMQLYYENIQVVSDFSQVDDAILKLTTNFAASQVAQGEAWLNEQCSAITAVTTGFESLDIIPRGVDKGFGLRHLCQELGISTKEVMAFGDNLNDLQMLEEAGLAVAPTNARDEIKAVSDYIIGHHKEGSVLDFIEKEVLA
ncbi:Cof-type HAD-IIB family hydrolase [Streptococcus sp. DD12]|uniref:Cof-type HAD-IIB family hydrolase n=1 Tax=Streptococcus sp. DD12 TaxID=1777880 RepID=UPI00079B6739|nr:Cof-type HAD-IIB family hydrolase [Streptococcus sp. DD12]KXT76913.1 Hydrolase (HAD superfamily) [Streptococcus sp. DD12]